MEIFHLNSRKKFSLGRRRALITHVESGETLEIVTSQIRIIIYNMTRKYESFYIYITLYVISIEKKRISFSPIFVSLAILNFIIQGTPARLHARREISRQRNAIVIF